MSEKPSKWYFSENGEIIGPCNLEEMRDAISQGRVTKETMISYDDSKWQSAESYPSILALLNGISAKLQEHKRKRVQRMVSAVKYHSRLITVSTSNPSPGRVFEIIDTVFALEADGGKPRMFDVDDGNPFIAFERVKASLESRARHLGADAVVNCQFEYRIAVGGCSIFGETPAQVIEFFGYGTAIRYVKEEASTNED